MAKLATVRRSLILLVLAAIFTATLAGCFVWGYFVHRDRVFPYHLLLNLAVEADLVAPPRLDNQLVRRSADPHAGITNLPYVSARGAPALRQPRLGRMAIWRMTRLAPEDRRLPPGVGKQDPMVVIPDLPKGAAGRGPCVRPAVLP